jgi:hypothetical protein
LCELLKCIVPHVIVGVSDSNPSRSTTLAEAADFDRAYAKLYDGLIEACKLHPGMTDTIFEDRVAAIRNQIQKQFVDCGG